MYINLTDSVNLIMVFHPFLFKSGRILVAPHHLPPVLSWVARGYPVLPHLTWNLPSTSLCRLGFTYAVPQHDRTVAIIPIPLLSIVSCFAVVADL